MGILESDLVMPIKVRNDDNYLKIDKLRNSGWEYLGIPGNTGEYLGILGNTWEYLFSITQIRGNRVMFY